jgi:hypothetical protein
LSKAALDRKIHELEALRTAPPAVAEEAVRRALKDRSNYLASRAAALVGDLHMRGLVPDLVAAFDRFMTTPAKSDPQCWAKNAIAKALHHLEHDDPAVFLRGIAHLQPEPVWGGSEDTAATLRGTCALALAGTRLDTFEILVRLTDLLADPEKPVRIDAARALGQLGARECALPLRLKALSGDRDPEVTGECLSALFGLSARSGLDVARRLLTADDGDVRLEVAGVLAGSHEPEALDILKEFWDGQADPEVRRSIVAMLGGSPLPAAAEFLLAVVQDASAPMAAHAISALRAGRYHAQTEERVAAIVAGRHDPELSAALQAAFRRG